MCQSERGLVLKNWDWREEIWQQDFLLARGKRALIHHEHVGIPSRHVPMGRRAIWPPKRWLHTLGPQACSVHSAFEGATHPPDLILTRLPVSFSWRDNIHWFLVHLRYLLHLALSFSNCVNVLAFWPISFKALWLWTMWVLWVPKFLNSMDTWALYWSVLDKFTKRIKWKLVNI